MRSWWRWILTAVLCAPATAALGAHCALQADMAPQERQTLTEAAAALAQAVLSQNLGTLEMAMPAGEKASGEAIRASVVKMAPLFKGGRMELRALYLLDATEQSAPADTQFFCSNASASLVVSIQLRALPPGRYALALADAAGSAYAGQIGLALVWDHGWKLAGLNMRPGLLDGHDSVWFWTQARQLSQAGLSWPAWYSYEAARFLSSPVDYLSSPNLERLSSEQAQLKNPPPESLPLRLADENRAWKIASLELDPSLLVADLALVYESAGVSDPAALRTEATAAMSALLKAHPELRQSFHGLWAYALRDGQRTPVLELPMEQIP